MKRILSILLIFAMLMTLGVASVRAEDVTNVSDKLTPALRMRIDTHAVTGGDGRTGITVYFADEALCINDMPGWSKGMYYLSDTSSEYAEYLINHNLALMQEIFADCPGYQSCAHPYKGCTYYADADYTLTGCCVAYDFDMNDIAILAADPRVKRIDCFPIDGTNPKYGTLLPAVLNAVEPEDWITVDVHRAGAYKTVADMPSFPTGRGTVEEIQAQLSAAHDEYAAYQREVEAVFFAEAFADVDVQYLFEGGNFAIVAVKAQDISTIASRDAVRDIGYFYNAITEPDDGYNNPYLYSKIDPALADAVTAQQESGIYSSVDVYVDLELDTKLMQDMPSWPDYAAARQEYITYMNGQSKLYDEAVDAIVAAIGKHAIGDMSAVCYEALTAKVAAASVVDLALCPQVRSVRLWDPDDLNRSKHYDYDDAVTGTRYRDRLLAQYSDLHWETKSDRAPLTRYEELCYHMYVPDDKPYAYDWALVEAEFACAMNCAIYSEVVGGRVLYAPGWKQQPFTFGVGLYDAEQDRFFDLTEIDFDDYPELYETFQQLDLGIRDDAVYYGDTDGDGSVTIMDATRIQRRLAGLCPKYSIIATAADVDRDGRITILDATRIQRYKAKICLLDGSVFQAG